MNIVVPIKLVPDLVEELSVDESGKALDTTYLRMKLNEFDDHAIEQAILLQERYSGEVIVLAPDMEGADDALYTCAAKGVQQLIKLMDDFDNGISNHALAQVLADAIRDLHPNLILTGVQAHNDLDGPLPALLAGYLHMPYVGYVAGVSIKDNAVTVRKEYPGGLVANMQVTLPAVLGIQAAESPPRYVAFSKIRQAMKTVAIEEWSYQAFVRDGGPTVNRLYLPETGEGAILLEGDVSEIAEKLVSMWVEQGIL